MDDDSESHSPAPNQANVNGKIYWDQVNGSILITVEDTAGNESTLTLGVLTSGSLGLQVADDTGLVLFDAFQTTSVIVSDTNITGDFTDIQTALAAVQSKGGGQVFLRNGTYLLDSDIIMPENTTLIGETGSGVVIDFQGNANQILVGGSLTDTTGTIAVTNNSMAIVGTGTAFDVAWVGQSIVLKGRWFTISDVTNATNLTVDTPFDADDITGYATVIGSPIGGINLKDFTVQNSTHADGAVYYQYTSGCGLDNISPYSSTIGLNFLNSSNTNIKNFFVAYNDTGMQILNSSTWTINNYEVYGSTGDNIIADKVYNVSNANATVSTAGSNNFMMTDCASWGFYDFENTTAGVYGIEMVDCSDIEVSSMAVRRAVSDGIKLTSGCDRIGMTNISLLNNGGWGLNIADASDDKNTITGSFFAGNTSGTVQNNGTGTINANNQT